MRNLVKSLRLTLVFCVFFSICYILVLWIFGLIVGPGGGNAETLVLNGRVVGAANVGQQFTKDVYFWVRPMRVTVMTHPVHPAVIKGRPMKNTWPT